MTRAALPIVLLVSLSITAACDDKAGLDTGGLGGGDGADGADGGADGAGDGGGGGDGGADGADGGDGGGDGGTVPMIQGTVEGTVTVELYRTVDGAREAVDWASVWGSSFPYGRIFIGAYEDAGGGRERYVGSQAIQAPVPGPNPYQVTVTLPAEGPVYLYASLDENNDTIIASMEPTGAWPGEVLISEDATTGGVDITILVDVDGLGGGGSSGGGGCSEVNLNGPVTLNTSYAGMGYAMLLGLDGSGPYDGGFFTVAEGAPTTYSFDACANSGNLQLIGAIDSNQNNLIDPADLSGPYVYAPDSNGNPITVSTFDLNGYEIQIPLIGDDGEPESYGINVVPFVTLTGVVTVEDGTFDSLDAGSSVYVAALKYRPLTGVSVSTFATDAYDVDSWTWAELTGQSSKTFSLIVPANQQVYLWAYADEDVNGVVNQTGEAVASGGTNDNGGINTGTSDSSWSLALMYN